MWSMHTLKQKSLTTTERSPAHLDSPANTHGKQVELPYGLVLPEEEVTHPSSRLLASL
jgi:hypothetical protein